MATGTSFVGLGNFVCVVLEGGCEQVAASGSTSGTGQDIWYMYQGGNICNIHLLHMQPFGGTLDDVFSVNMDICR
jgi:hypothetical protein